MANQAQVPSHCCFQSWLVQQDEEIKLLMQALTQEQVEDDKQKLCQLVETCVKHYEDYHKKRLVHARSNPSLFLAPTWCSAFENTNLWIGGCRPTLFIQLIYTLSGISIESQLSEFLEGVKKGSLGALSAAQLGSLNDLHLKTIREEDSLTSRMASMQDQTGDRTLVAMASESTSDVNRVFESYEVIWVDIMEEADKLRLNTLRELLDILTPLQAVEFLLAGKKLQLAMHEWCKSKGY